MRFTYLFLLAFPGLISLTTYFIRESQVSVSLSHSVYIACLLCLACSCLAALATSIIREGIPGHVALSGEVSAVLTFQYTLCFLTINHIVDSPLSLYLAFLMFVGVVTTAYLKIDRVSFVPPCDGAWVPPKTNVIRGIRPRRTNVQKKRPSKGPTPGQVYDMLQAMDTGVLTSNKDKPVPMPGFISTDADNSQDREDILPWVGIRGRPGHAPVCKLAQPSDDQSSV